MKIDKIGSENKAVHSPECHIIPASGFQAEYGKGHPCSHCSLLSISDSWCMSVWALGMEECWEMRSMADQSTSGVISCIGRWN